MRTGDGDHRKQQLQLTDKQRELLHYLEKTNGQNFNVRNYAKKFNISRSYAYDLIRALVDKGFLEKDAYTYTLTNLGTNVINAHRQKPKGIRAPTQVGKLSVHYLRYQMDIMDDSKFSVDRLRDELHPLSCEPNKLPNYTQYFAKFDDATIVIDKNTFSIRVHDLVVNDVDQGHYEGFTIATKYFEKLRDIGLYGENMRLPQGHWARIEDALAKNIEKKHGKYKVTLASGKSFWVDNSPPHKVERESDDPLFQKKIDKFMLNVESGALEADFQQIKETIAKMLELQQGNMELQKQSIEQVAVITTAVQNVIQCNEITTKNVEQLAKLMHTTFKLFAPQEQHISPLKPGEFPNYIG